ncbi:nicotinate-nucleotide adenylyltransferase [bacterium DOLJORAL78_65_58]|nr:MAG: nicotinate-nucleotide adenylyltransferase [bacterium DOLZORAL124_64_63]PIE76127.1 MAG: nicotinate-nucleotide adenylyltransferase [bacterium DOLJORAL78_65_58]
MKDLLHVRKATATTLQKALEINLDLRYYGSIVEIGAGQEVARNFFQAGGASGTIAQTSSAYDMRFSDAIYGPDDTGRYVTRHRLQRMLEREFQLVVERVSKERHPDSCYFAFANTVSAKRYGVDSECHGWLGIRFQHQPGAEPSQVVLHVLMLDSSNLGQQTALGTLGVNLIHSTFKYQDNVDELVDSLTENLGWGRIDIDYIHFDGPCFKFGANRQMPLKLVTSSQGPVVMFNTDGTCAIPGDLLYKKIPLILRGTFRPFTNVHEDMIAYGREGLCKELGVKEEDIVVLCEVNVARYLYEDADDVSDLRARVDMLAALGYHSMVTSHLRFFRLGEYFLKHQLRRIAFVLSVVDLDMIFDQEYYAGLSGGILHAISKIFASDSKIMTYPILTAEGEVCTLDNHEVAAEQQYLFKHLIYNRRILALEPPREKMVPFALENIGDLIARGDERWMDLVPEVVRRRIGELKI